MNFLKYNNLKFLNLQYIKLMSILSLSIVIVLLTSSCSRSTSSRPSKVSTNIKGETIGETIPSEELPQREIVPQSIVANNLIIGQADFRYGLNQNSFATASSLYFPTSVLKVASLYYVSDRFNNRINVYNSLESAALFHLGQADSTSSLKNKGGDTARDTLNDVGQIASDGTNLVVSDIGNHRVLIWHKAPTSSGVLPDVVLGQADFSGNLSNRDGSPNASINGMNSPYGVAVQGTKLIVSDTFNNRLLIWNSIPISNGADPDLVVGQNDGNSNGYNRGGVTAANSFAFPTFLDTDGTKLVVSDLLNHRVLVFNTVPSSSNANADSVFCQPNFTSASFGTDSSSCYYPNSAKIVDNSLYLVDYFNNRILYFENFEASESPKVANGVFGQSDLQSGNSNAGGRPTADTLFQPMDISYIDSKLIVSDSFNHRLLILESLPTGVGVTTADSVIGQNNFESNLINNKQVSDDGFKSPMCIDMNDDYVIVGDRYNSRLLIYDKEHIENGPIRVLGQNNFTDSCDVTNCGSASANNIKQLDGGCVIDSENRIIVSDRYNNRVLIWNSFPSENGANADLVLGQADFVSSSANSSGIETEENGLKNLSAPMGLALSNDRLFVSDMGNNRILAYTYPISENNQAAVLYIGQPDAVSSAAGLDRNKFHLPMGVTIADNKLIVTEYSNARALVFDSVPSVNNPDASYVLGQPDFVTNNSGLSRNQMSNKNQSMRAAVIDGVLYIPERRNNRVLGFQLEKLTSGMDADYLIGQGAWDSKESSKLGNTEGNMYHNFYGPSALMEDPNGKYVWIIEQYSHRVMRVNKSDFLGSRQQP